MSINARNDLEQLQAQLELQKKLKNPGVSRKKIDKNELLDKIKEELGDCQRCPLAKTRTNLVFGAGNPDTTLMFVGEAPGRDEDREGIPFIGRAGQLLTKIIQAINMTREQVYITNILKCRPPNNRNPETEEIERCYPFLQQQIKVIQPRIICALGAFAAQTLLQTKTPIGKLRSRGHPFNEHSLVIPTYHPAFLLRNPHKKRDVWEDMQLVMKLLG